MPNQFMSWWSSVACDWPYSFRDEPYGDVKTSGNNVGDETYGDETYGDETYGDITSLYLSKASDWQEFDTKCS